ncbi:undecaprenyl pyrophosphate synthase [Spiroplasma litorale]|uniref:Isoprenyl transferase n=1 Tax=Spiroplasma litorale TaxID=216942 RepID=A0A0K1W1G4_9MOLU|nr:polyprenyl diphosphate synthase [Spiroplasma litorale]AKX33932.1 undecaprenyl pyrophosphate synthase [Spiroplasma litorale]
MIYISKIEHIALIIDGNGRWAKKFHRPRTYGHRVGIQNIWPTILAIKKQNIKYASFYCFSTENWNRPDKEVEFLINFPVDFFNRKKQEEYLKNDIKVVWVGRRDRMPTETKKIIEEVEEKTKNCSSLIFNLCIDYGSFDEIQNAIKKIMDDCENKLLNKNDFEIKDLFKYLYTEGTPPIDLLIRTGGEQRLSNFMLLQASYAELYFTKKYWPEFREHDLLVAIDNYISRERRYGEIKNGK